MQETQGSAFPSPDVKYKREFEFSESSNHGSDCPSKVSKDVPTTDLNETVTQEHGMLRVVRAAIDKVIERNFCGTEENGRVNTVTSKRPTCSSGIETEIKTESTDEYGQSSSLNTAIHTNFVCPVEFTSLQAIDDESLKDQKVEEEVVSPTDLFDELFQDYVNKLNVTAEANNIEVAISDDECGSIASSSTAESYEEVYFQEIQVHEEETKEVVIKTDVNNKGEECSEGLNTITKQSNGYSLKSVNGKWISVASGIVYEDQVSSPESSQCSTMTQTMLSSKNSFCSHAVSLVSSKLPPGSTLVSDRGAFHTNDREKPYACGYCGTNYKRKKDVYRHIMKTHEEKHVTIHTQEKPFSCDQCGMRFRLKSDHCRHKLMHTEERVFPCKICNKWYMSKCDIFGHSELHKEEEYREGIICNICKKEFRHHHHLKEHMMTHTREKPFKCSLCDKNFRLELHLLHHMITHKAMRNLLLGEAHDPEENTIKVPVQLVTSQGIKLQDDNHLGENTAQEKTQNVIPEHRLSTALQKDDSADRGKGSSLIMGHRCNIEQKDTNCNSDEADRGVPPSSSSRATGDHGKSSSFYSPVDFLFTPKLPPGSILVNVRGVFHTQDKKKPFACGYCGKNYTWRKGVCGHVMRKHEEKHVTNHTQEKPFTCDQCGMRFRLKTDHCRHKLMHTEERVFPCKICSKSYTSKCNLFGHSEVHKEDEYREDVICNICKKEFRHHHHLKEHMMIHTREKPFKCSLCDKNFRLEIHLLRHMITHDEMRNLLLREAHDSESEINVPVQLITDQDIKKFNQDNSKTEEKIIQDCILSSVNCTTLVEQLPSNTGLVESNIHHFQLEDSQLQTKPSLPTTHSELAATNNYGKSSSGFSLVESMVTSRLPPGSTLVSDRGVFRINDREKPFVCGYCGKAYKKKHAVYVHIISHHNEKRYSCEFCGKSYSQQCSLNLHVRNHTQEKQFSCDQCGMQFRWRCGLRRHKFTHAEVRPFSCKKCNKSFKSSDDLSRHSKVHNKEQQRKDFVCNVCKVKFKIPSMLKKHMMIHTGEKPFKCSLCDKHFRLKINLRYHMNTHSGKKKYKSCSVCGKSVSANYMLTHMRMHTGEKPFECNICGKRFPKKQLVEGHIRSHTGEKPFACSRCDRRFALYSSMAHHKAKCTGLSVNVAGVHS